MHSMKQFIVHPLLNIIIIIIFMQFEKATLFPYSIQAEVKVWRA
jgi:hypothetical protein